VFPGGTAIWTWVLISVLALAAASLFTSTPESAPAIPYSAFRSQLEAGNVAEVRVQGGEIAGRLKQPATREIQDRQVPYERFTTFLPSYGDEDLAGLLREQNVEVTTLPEKQASGLWLLFISLLPVLLLIGFFAWQYQRMRGGGVGQNLFAVGKSRAKLYDKRTENIGFDQVAGAEGAKVELSEIVTYLKNPERVRALGADVPRGVLLVGPPGTGKTLLARAVAGESEVPFYSVTGSDFMEMFVGVGASRVRDMFKEARKEGTSIIFIDELDSIGRRRGAGLGGGHDEREQTLNQILSEMDGFEPNEQVVVLAATNRPDILDPALLRPGRFDRRVMVDLPNAEERLAILRLHARKKPMAEEIDMERLARGTPGFSGADLENLLNEAALLAAREDAHVITPEHVENARDKILLEIGRAHV